MNDPTKPGFNPGGCLILLIFFVIETAAGFGVGAFCYPFVFGLIEPLVPVAERDFAGVVSVIICFIPAGFVAWWIDRLCVKISGQSVFDAMSTLPSFP
ncbi:hypothetical protein M0208_05455 [Sphingomonas sp. SUN019]|uniref:hypothetical protein n=1 Tax=Sphingomonas sp. SUN019 TaxID=2937788 RepID=UPI00216471AB|nr:hypothetical protein [Sphingomonas sp. SUN019]UVO49993.1 hypothetical protein M0208_05455 [Sphingomonas sp. SUN019]